MKVVATTATEGRGMSWKGEVRAEAHGLLFTHRCNHSHRTMRNAERCAEDIASDLSEAIVRTGEGATR